VPGIRLALVLSFAASIVASCSAGPAVTPMPSPSPSPSPIPSPSPTPAALTLPTTDGAALAAGTYYVEDRPTTMVKRLTFAVPNGWEMAHVVGKDVGTPGEVEFGWWSISHIFTDACKWDEASIVDAGTTADQLVNALADQHSRTASAVTDTTVGGFPAKRIELTVSPTLDTATCTSGNLRYWPSAGRPIPDFGGGMCCNPAGNIDVIYAADVAGNRVVIVARHYPGSSSQNLAEIQSIVDSIVIEP
jgi:hypothetical protein